jgi:hypothetical protein
MSIPPEVAFHRFFRSKELSATDREDYKGKKDLDQLQPAFRSLLAGIQEALNEALRNEKQNVPEHVDHLPFHFDFVDSRIPNALAFRFDGFSFIGITMPLVYMLWDACSRLSRSDAVLAALGIPLAPEVCDPIHALLLGTQLGFVVVHEYTHHVHGHLARSRSDTVFPNEILGARDSSNLERQAQEVDADGYAVYHVMADLIDGNRRHQALSLLGLEEQKDSMQDEVLFSSFVVAVGAFLFTRPPSTVDSAGIYQLTHPPQAARMNFILHFAISWCRQNRPRLEAHMTRERFQSLMTAVATTTWGMNGGADWSAQTVFLQSDDGSRYISKLDHCVKAHIQSL